MAFWAEKQGEKEMVLDSSLTGTNLSIQAVITFQNPTEDMKVVWDSLARETSRLRAVTVIEFLIENDSDLRLALQLLHSPLLTKSTTRQEELRRQNQTQLYTLWFRSHLHCLILQAWLLFTKWAKVGDVHWDTCECLTADALEFWCKDAAGITGADHLTVKKETDSSWKANEHVSAIWGSWPKRYPSSAPRQRGAVQPHQSRFHPSFFFSTVNEAQSCNPF